MKKMNLKNSKIATRKDAYSIDPRKINVNHEDNPRNDYGDEEEFGEFKESIRIYGLLQPVAVYIDPNEGTAHLAHGFRRMKAILELIEEGVNFESIPVIQVENNEETVLIQHFVMNTGKKLSDLELGDTLLKLSILMGEENYAEISRRTGINALKVSELIKFAKKASSKLKLMVREKKLTLKNAKSLATAKDIRGQNEALAEAEAKVQGTDRKITPEDLGIVNALDVMKTSPYYKIRTYINEVKSSNNGDLDQDFTERLENLLDEMEAKNLNDKEIMGRFFMKQTEQA